MLEAGAERVVIGTAALRDPEFLDAALAAHGERVVVSVDTRGGKVSLSGWTETSDVEAPDAVAELTERGVQRFLCTAIEVDGTMEGPAIDQLNEIAAATSAQVIASGGVGDLCPPRSNWPARARVPTSKAQSSAGSLRAQVHRRRGHRRPNLRPCR